MNWYYLYVLKIYSQKKNTLFIICRILFFLFAGFLFQKSSAQAPVKNNFGSTFRIIQWGVDRGLPQLEIHYLLKDKYGFLWVSTGYGLSRFDGSVFKNYYTGKNKTQSVIGNSIEGLIEDSLHNIWIGTNKGMSRYDIKADTFSHFQSASLSGINPFWATANEVYCIEDDFTIDVININTLGKRKIIKIDSNASINLFSTPRSMVFDAKSNCLWMTEIYDKIGQALCRISLSDGKIEYFRWPCYKNIRNHHHEVECIRYDRLRNCIWLNSPDGLVQFTLEDEKFHNIEPLNKDIKEGRWVGIELDFNNRVWIATVDKGILIYDPADLSVKSPFPEDPALQKEFSDFNYCIYCDRDNMIWAGYWLYKGLYQLIPFAHSLKHFGADTTNPHALSDGNILECINGDHGKVWMSTGDGLNIFNPLTESFQILRQKDLPGFMGGSKWIVITGMDTLAQKAWVLTFGTLDIYELDIATKKCRLVIFKDSLGQIISNIRHYYPVAYKKGCIEMSVYKGRMGVFMMSGDSGIAHQIFSLPENETLGAPFATLNDHLFIWKQGSRNTLTYIFSDGKWTRYANALDSFHVDAIAYNEKDQTYWVISERQLIHYDKLFRELKRYSQEDGLPEFDIIKVIIDNRGDVWLGTDRSILRLNAQTGKIITVTEKDGFEKQNYSEWCSNKDVYGNLYFPSGRAFGDGFDMVMPEKFRETYPPSTVYFQSLEINQKPFPLKTGVNDIQELLITHLQNKISIGTGIIDYYNNGKSTIRYKLEGLNETWQYGPSNYTIRYDGLAPAKYKLIIQASNAANDFNGPEKTLIIQIAPPWWTTWWFRILVGILIVSGFYIIVRYRLQQKFHLRLESSEKEKELADMRQKTAELKQQTTELEMQALRAQMNPHFIFNSLNSINRFILQNNRLQASEYLTKFSRLVRLILQNSQAAMITLESELESVNLYLSLEALRFDYHFEYKLSVYPDLDISALKVPPLIIQPYVENAVWHGLMHKEEKGQLDIELSQENDFLYFKITDNGIGRKQATAMASKSATRYKSMGLSITAHRIAMMNHGSDLGSSVVVNDLVNSDGTAAGTEVIIKIPAIVE